MSTKIQINSLEALERLIGGDTNVEIEIRNSIVQEFAKKHLKAMVSHPLIVAAVQNAMDEVRQEFMTIAVNSRWTEPVMRSNVLETFKVRMREQANEELYSIINNAVSDNKRLQNIDAEIDVAANWILNQLAPDVLESRLNKMVDARLKERLGING